MPGDNTDPDLSSNRSLSATNPPSTQIQRSILVRHADFSFSDGNIAVLAGKTYFVVHRGLLARHSPVLKRLIDQVLSSCSLFLEDLPTLLVPHAPQDMLPFLQTLYGLSISSDRRDFQSVSAILRLSTVYHVYTLRDDMIHQLTQAWPTSLRQWEIRERDAVNGDGMYTPRQKLPHPIVMINLAREVDVPALLPSAFYDLSRYLPSQIANGYKDPCSPTAHRLSSDDLFKIFRGKEQTARYFSTFIVNELEGRMPSKFCLNRTESHPSLKRSCQIAFETITLAILRDTNGMLLNHNSDPLFAISGSLMMQTKEDEPGAENRAAYRACEACRLEYGAVVKAARDEFWRRLPEWFDLPVTGWG